MKPAYRNLAIAAGGAVAVAVAASLMRLGSRRRPLVAHTMTVSLHREQVGAALNDSRLLSSAVGCDGIEITRNGDASQIIEWSCPEHPAEHARLALIAAPADRGTELHLSMAAENDDVIGVVRRLKMLLETGEIATGAFQ